MTAGILGRQQQRPRREERGGGQRFTCPARFPCQRPRRCSSGGGRTRRGGHAAPRFPAPCASPQALPAAPAPQLPDPLPTLRLVCSPSKSGSAFWTMRPSTCGSWREGTQRRPASGWRRDARPPRGSNALVCDRRACTCVYHHQVERCSEGGGRGAGPAGRKGGDSKTTLAMTFCVGRCMPRCNDAGKPQLAKVKHGLLTLGCPAAALPAVQKCLIRRIRIMLRADNFAR